MTNLKQLKRIMAANTLSSNDINDINSILNKRGFASLTEDVIKTLQENVFNNKYKQGEFGYWWTVTKGNEDIEGTVYNDNIYCSDNNLTSLKGCPQKVGGVFDCSSNELTSLEGAPQTVGGNFDCYNNKLTSLKGCPQKVSGNFYGSDNKLTSLEGAPQEVGGNFSCYRNKLTSLKGAPRKVGGGFDCENNKVEFTEEDVRAVSNVKGRITV